MYTQEEVLKYIEEEEAKFIRLAFIDAFGVQKNISVMPGEVMKAFEEGIPVNAHVIAGFRECPQASLYLRPDPSTLTILPWRPDTGKVLRMFCDITDAEGRPYSAGSRHLLQEAVKTAREAGVEFRFGSETEFYLFSKTEDGQETRIPYDNAGYMDIAPADRCENVRREICLTIERMGLTPERSHHEQGPGQNEIDFHNGRPLKAADQMTTFKMVVHTVADRYGLSADFSPLPLPGKPGNGYHINIYATDKGGRDVARMAAAGILEKVRDMTIFLNPTDASYARLGNNSAPDRANWSDAGRSELMYIETIRDGRTRVELRSPDAASNPYLVYALLIYAGLDGIKRQLSLPDCHDADSLPLPASKKEAAKIATASDFIKTFVPAELIREYTSC